MDWVSFPGLGIGKIFFNDFAFKIFNLKIYMYAIIFSLAVVVGTFYAYFYSEKIGVLRSKYLNVVFFGIVFGIVGARFYYVLFNLSDFFKKDVSIWQNFLEVINLRSGGIAIYGGLIFAFVAGLVVCKIEKVQIPPMLDLAGMGLLIAQAIGRWGNFFNVEAYGIKTDLPWGMMSSRIPQCLQPVHPTFFYESIWCFIGFLLLNFLFKRRKFDGELFLIYLIWYGFERFFVEGLRTDSLMFFQTKIRVSQALSLFLFVAAVLILFYFYFKFRKSKAKLYAETEVWRKILNQKRK